MKSDSLVLYVVALFCTVFSFNQHYSAKKTLNAGTWMSHEKRVLSSAKLRSHPPPSFDPSRLGSVVFCSVGLYVYHVCCGLSHSRPSPPILLAHAHAVFECCGFTRFCESDVDECLVMRHVQLVAARRSRTASKSQHRRTASRVCFDAEEEVAEQAPVHAVVPRDRR